MACKKGLQAEWNRVSHMNLPSMSSSVQVGPLIFWVTLLSVKHLVADFFLQTKWIADGKEARTGWAAPLLVHCAIHGALSTAIILVFEPRLWFLGLVDFAIHFIADRAKGYFTALYGFGPSQTWFWWLLGIDQAYHRLTDFGLALILALAE
jgi:hypothetical protein